MIKFIEIVAIFGFIAFVFALFIAFSPTFQFLGAFTLLMRSFG
jgi:hypothetical protein